MKETGILLAVSSLPSRTGVGELGRPAYEWIDLLAGSGVSIWQILPQNRPALLSPVVSLPDLGAPQPFSRVLMGVAEGGWVTLSCAGR